VSASFGLPAKARACRAARAHRINDRVLTLAGDLLPPELRSWLRPPCHGVAAPGRARRW
jgi:hypothetical protein